MEMERKSFGAWTIKDEARGEVRAVIGKINDVDKDGDVFLPSSMNGSRIKLSSYGHDVILENAPPAGLATLSESGGEIILDGRFFLSTFRGRESFATVQELGAEGEWSVGFPRASVKTAPMTDEWKAKGARRLIEQWTPIEGSPVFIGAQNGTRTLSTKAASDSLTDRLEAVHEALWARNNGLPKPWYAREIFDNYVIVCEDYGGRMFRVPYTLGEGGTVTLGEGTEVQVVYEPVSKAAPNPAETKAEEPTVIEVVMDPLDPKQGRQISTDVEKSEPEKPAVVGKSAEEAEQEALAEISSSIATMGHLASVLEAKESANVELARISEELAVKRERERVEAKRAKDEADDAEAADLFAQFEKTRRRLAS